MSIVAVIGTQWGDEGKGKVVDRYGQQAHWVVRYQGGNNAGHTIVVGNEKKILHLIPSGAMHPQAGVALGQGVVISPEALIQEIESLSGVYTLESRLKVDLRAHVVTPMQIAADIQREQRGSGVGSTRNGIGPCHEDRAGKRGVRCGDFLFNPEQARRQLEKQIEHWSYAGSGEQVFMELAGFIRKLEKIFANVTDLVLDAYQQGKNILLEGAQGHLLDPDFGTYPHVTSSNPGIAGIAAGLGIDPRLVSHVTGVVKAVMTRVGDGAFPSQLVQERWQKEEVMKFIYEKEGITAEEFEAHDSKTQNVIRKKWAAQFSLPEDYAYVMQHLSDAEKYVQGQTVDPLPERLATILGSGERKQTRLNHLLGMYFMAAAGEFGATTGRPRRTGWLDLVALKDAVEKNGINGLAITKLDCLGDLPEVKVVVGYSLEDQTVSKFPEFRLQGAIPVYECLSGWDSRAVTRASIFVELPGGAQSYVRRIEDFVHCPVHIIGTGPGRNQAIELHHPFSF